MQTTTTGLVPVSNGLLPWPPAIQGQSNRQAELCGKLSWSPYQEF